MASLRVLNPIYRNAAASTKCSLFVRALSSKIPSSVKIVEVGPRDGLQNEPTPVATRDKVELVTKLAQAGCSTIEPTAFVSPKAVPQMSDATQVMEGLSENVRNSTTLSCLVPNVKGLERAISAGADEVAIFGSASETFSQRNINCSIAESMERFSAVMQVAHQQDIPVRGYVSCVLGCPYGGDVPPDKVASVAGQLAELGCYEISLGDTVGVGTPGSTIPMLEATQVRKVNVAIEYVMAVSNRF